ncbi:MAG TPA: 30S ribosome-binding factor RbfA [Kiritimatiellia bacterium]|jgi:ribosome-binding factor A|nr:30S ribosome-binding factor RbfA [Kiritimatiellia bacterium]HOR97340.1 30S ribosome-binding factor RbfA [Kiritimatiellia bacterium]HPC49596.1 30S ribosome-binding factor RbfA [Kiritimatiellia bacterium]HPK37744.1 30S ribosome-binding factor RbfA [Kiritimatiellia bacterium]HPW75126.1 30S ribosome-binding factor RbfA [Kiritimatiellia bacterium]
MAVDRVERLNALLRREIGEALYKVFASDPLDLAAITVTKVRVARNLRNATVQVSIFGHESERGEFIRKLAGKAKELQALINRNLNLKYTPRLRFELDGSLEKGDRVLDVLSRLEGLETHGETNPAPDVPPG